MIKNKHCILILFFTLIFHSQVRTQTLSSDVKEILMLQDTRSLGENNKLLKYLKSDNAELVKKTLLALANIGDTNTLGEAGYVLINHNNSEVRKYAAFTLGQIPNKKSVLHLFKALSKEKNEEVLNRIFEALGKTGDEEELNLICGYESNNEVIKSSIAMAIARFGMRKIKSHKGFEKLISLMYSSGNAQVLKNVAYALNRIGDEQFLSDIKPEIIKLTNVNDKDTRMWAYNALGKTKDPSFIRYFIDGLNTKDWRLKVNILNSISNLKVDSNYIHKDSIIPLLMGNANENNESVQILTLSAVNKLLNNFSLDESELDFLKLLNLTVLFSPEDNMELTWRQKSEAANSIAMIFKDWSKSELLEAFYKSSNYDLKANVIKSFRHFSDGMIYREVRDSISAEVQRYNITNPNKTGALIGSEELVKLYRAFVELLLELDNKVDSENQNIIRLIYSEFLSSKDPVLVDFCLTGLLDSLYLQHRVETSQILLFDYNELHNPNDLDIILLFINAMGELKITAAKDILEKNLKSENYEIAKASADALFKITGRNYENSITSPKYRTDFDWHFIENLSKKRFAVIKTNKGDIKLELFPDIAPFTVQNFVKLAEKKYYDGTVFHRVVPNFVIQGGDPTGTGYSGPGYSIRSEFSPLTYERGYLGMASSGKDTEGSQFFITHSPQPHLDGRYTIFGKVIEGIEVVNNIMIGDVINSIRFNKY